MNLQELIKWASDYDTQTIAQEKNARVRSMTYLTMIVDKGVRIIENNKQNEDYLEDIKEHLEHLKKMGVKHSSLVDTGTEPMTSTDNPATEQKKEESPLIP